MYTLYLWPDLASRPPSDTNIKHFVSFYNCRIAFLRLPFDAVVGWMLRTINAILNVYYLLQGRCGKWIGLTCKLINHVSLMTVSFKLSWVRSQPFYKIVFHDVYVYFHTMCCMYGGVCHTFLLFYNYLRKTKHLWEHWCRWGQQSLNAAF